MFKFAKYYMLVNLYKHAKKNIIRVFLSILIIVIVSYLFADIDVVAGEENRYGFLALKWMIFLILISMVVINIRQIIKKISSPFSKEDNDPVIGVKKKRILAKEHLMTKSDRIIEKYRSTS